MKKLYLIFLFIPSWIISFGQSPDRISFELITQTLIEGDSNSLKKKIDEKGFVKTGNAWTLPSINQNDSITNLSLEIRPFFNKSYPLIYYYERYESWGVQKYFYYLFDIKDIHYYMKEAVKSVNKDKVKTYVWAYNDKKNMKEGLTVFHFYPEKVKGKKIVDTEIYLLNDKVLLISKIVY